MFLGLFVVILVERELLDGLGYYWEGPTPTRQVHAWYRVVAPAPPNQAASDRDMFLHLGFYIWNGSVSQQSALVAGLVAIRMWSCCRSKAQFNM